MHRRKVVFKDRRKTAIMHRWGGGGAIIYRRYGKWSSKVDKSSVTVLRVMYSPRRG